MEERLSSLLYFSRLPHKHHMNVILQQVGCHGAFKSTSVPDCNTASASSGKFNLSLMHFNDDQTGL